MKYGVLTVSDRCYLGKSADLSGPAVTRIVGKIFPDFHCEAATVPDEIDSIQEFVKLWCCQELAVIFTTGGTGFSPRDVTPEAVAPLIEKRADGLAQAMISAGSGKTAFAVLSRPVCGIRQRSIIITLPGSPRAVEDILLAIGKTLPHAVKLVRQESTDHTDGEMKNVGQATRTLSAELGQTECRPAQSIVEQRIVERPRKSPFRMLEMQEAIDTITRVVTQRFSEQKRVRTVKTQDALGHFCAENLYTERPFPPFRTSTRDGYAICSSGSMTPLVRCQPVTAGPDYPEFAVNNETCVRISTGAVLPTGANAVVMVEDTVLITADTDCDQEQRIEIVQMPTPNENIREVGSDFRSGELLLEKGTRINAASVGLLLMAGVSSVPTFVPPVVGVLSTGNEVSGEFDERIGCVTDSNRPMLLSLLENLRIKTVDLGIVHDSEQQFCQKLIDARKNNCDILITTGGVSMGERDIVKRVLAACGYEVHFGRVNLKPGKPTTFASLDAQLVFALPGNPASAFVMFHMFVLRALHLLNCAELLREVEAVIELPQSHVLCPRPEFLRANLFADGSQLKVRPLLAQQSSSLFRYHTVNALISVPSIENHQGPIENGDTVRVFCLNF